MHESEEYFFQALRAGAAGYLVKKAAPTDLHMAILSVAQGGAYLYPGLAKTLVRAYTSAPLGALPPQIRENRWRRKLRVLSPRELEILRLVAAGHTNQEIADQLVLSIKTVQAHRANVMGNSAWKISPNLYASPYAMACYRLKLNLARLEFNFSFFA